MVALTEINSVLEELDSAIASVDQRIAEATLNNKDYLHWKHQHDRIIALSDEAQDELARNKKLLKSIEVSYDKHKTSVKENLEQSISNTLNTWYTGEHYDMEIRKKVTGRTENHFLVDRRLCSDLATVCGGSATQVSGSLILTAILSGEGSPFIFYDEAFSNTDSVTAKEIGRLISQGLNGLQIILIENKIELTENVIGLQYFLHYTKDKGTHVIKVRDDYNELEADSPYQAVNDPTIIVDLTELKTEREEELYNTKESPTAPKLEEMLYEGGL